MPQHPGYEPFTFVWVIQAYVNQVQSGKITATFLKVNIFTTEQGYLDWIAWSKTQTANQAYIYQIARNIGKQKWFNDRLWMQQQFNDMWVNGNWITDLQP